jgi:predicted RNase H-like nuclease (RuvC/YqgF family)
MKKIILGLLLSLGIIACPKVQARGFGEGVAGGVIGGMFTSAAMRPRESKTVVVSAPAPNQNDVNNYRITKLEEENREHKEENRQLKSALQQHEAKLNNHEAKLNQHEARLSTANK